MPTQRGAESTKNDMQQESLGAQDGSQETDSQQQLRQSLRISDSVSDSQVRLQLHSQHASLGELSGSQLAARLNSSSFGTEQVFVHALRLPKSMYLLLA